MITFLIVYKHNVSNVFNNLVYLSDGAPCLSDIQLKIIELHNWKINDFGIINIIPIKTEIKI